MIIFTFWVQLWGRNAITGISIFPLTLSLFYANTHAHARTHSPGSVKPMYTDLTEQINGKKDRKTYFENLTTVAKNSPRISVDWILGKVTRGNHWAGSLAAEIGEIFFPLPASVLAPKKSAAGDVNDDTETSLLTLDTSSLVRISADK